MIPVSQNDVTTGTENSYFTGFNVEALQGYVSALTERLQSVFSSPTASSDIEMTATTTTATAGEATNGFGNFNLQAVQSYLNAATQYLTPSTERMQAVSDYVSAVPARVQAIPENAAQGCQNISKFCQDNKDMVIKGAGALFLIGVIVACSTGAATCSTFHVINKTDKVLEINYLKPYSATFTDANTKHHENHPT